MREPTADDRVGVRTWDLGEKRLGYLRQLGMTSMFVNHADTDEESDEFNDPIASDSVAVGPGTIPSVEKLDAAHERVEDAGLPLLGIHSLPYSLYGDIMFGREGKTWALEEISTLIENLSEADIPTMGYQ
ncbi:hypothetical protein [Halosimplex amylolyticum]|uniref:hypothetical protein n=1 Tax=Halosimplex amylolyticum TaxID=3396616 RepID=UPI003F56CA92